jgi:hypothetical protein
MRHSPLVAHACKLQSAVWLWHMVIPTLPVTQQIWPAGHSAALAHPLAPSLTLASTAPGTATADASASTAPGALAP